MRTTVYRLPRSELEALVTTYDDGQQTLALRPDQYGSWGPPISPTDDERESATVYDATIQRCPLCGGDLAPSWEGIVKRCKGCGADIRSGLVRDEELRS